MVSSGVSSMGRVLVIAGAVLIVVGLVVMAAGRLGIPFGRLPGDVSYRGRHVTVFAPLATSLLLSLLVSLVLYLIARFRR